MTITERFQLGVGQHGVDFVDIDTQRDTPLFLDPYFLSIKRDRWSGEACRTIRSFFSTFLESLRANNVAHCREIFSHLGEPNETHLGLSVAASQGRGVGQTDVDHLLESLMQSRAVQTGLVEDIEDCRLFVAGIDKDKLSDMTTNIIRGLLIEYTQSQCRLHQIPLTTGIPSGDVWSIENARWEQYMTEMLVIDGAVTLLVPKGVVSYSEKYSSQQFHQHFALTFLKSEHLRMNTALVQSERRRDGTIKRWVTKKDVQEHEAPLDKEFLTDFAQRHPNVFREFKQKAFEQHSPRANPELSSLPSEALSGPETVSQAAESLAAQLRAIPPGTPSADEYHRVIAASLELIFYPRLHAPTVEFRTNEGRKRIDVIYNNSARAGFFFDLSRALNLPSSYIYVECKNYSGRARNPEYDQLAGRFDINTSKVGILCARTLDDRNHAIRTCNDHLRRGAGLILPLCDDDILAMLAERGGGNQMAGEDLLANLRREIAHNA